MEGKQSRQVSSPKSYLMKWKMIKYGEKERSKIIIIIYKNI